MLHRFPNMYYKEIDLKLDKHRTNQGYIYKYIHLLAVA